MNHTDKTYTFSLMLHRLERDYAELEGAFFNAGCDDALVGMRSGVVYLDFDREAPDLQSALLSAIRDVESAGVGAKVAFVEPGDLVTAAEIARRVGKSRESVRLWIEGERGAGNFPLPRAGVSGKTLLWSWLDVAGWLLEHEKIDAQEYQQAEIIYTLNKVLEELKPGRRLQVPDSFVAQLKSIRSTT